MIYYICSSYRADTKEQLERNIQYAKDLTREALLYGYTTITAHLSIAACLNDAEPEERKIDLAADLELLEKCDAVIVGQRYGISEGMAAEIEKAKRLNIPVFYRDREEW